MLVLSRQRDETIMIGDNVEITIVDIRGDKVRLGINAPTTVAVHRKEVYLAIQRENEEASRVSGGLAGGFDPAGFTPPLNAQRPKAPDAARLRERAAQLAAPAPSSVNQSPRPATHSGQNTIDQGLGRAAAARPTTADASHTRSHT